jgi:hypothetical protein
MCRIGKRKLVELAEDARERRGDVVADDQLPVVGFPSQPQCETVSRRRFQSCTGQPDRQKRGVSCARRGFDRPRIEYRYCSVAACEAWLATSARIVTGRAKDPEHASG